MAIGASTVWRVRVGGSDLNGAGFDSTVSGAGTDYTQQDSPQLSLTDLTSTNSTTITSATGGFTSAMIGNLLRISSGTGATTGYYVVTTRVDTNTITVDRVSGTYTAGVGRIGGGAATLARILTVGNATGDKVVPGNVIYVRGAGSDDPTSADYTYTASIAPVSGTIAAYVKIIGENGRPRFDGSGQTLFLAGFDKTHVWLENLMVKSGNDGGVYFRVVDIATDCVLKNVVCHTNDLDCDFVRTYGYGARFISCKFTSHETSPTTRSGRAAIKVLTASSASVKGCTFIRCGGNGVLCQAQVGLWADRNIIIGCKQHGVLLEATTNTNFMSQIFGNVIDGNTLDGINIADGSTLSLFQIISNLITNHSQASRYGIRVVSGTVAANDLFKIEDYNGFYGNTTDVGGISKGSNDVTCSADPYASVGTDYTLNSTAGGGAALKDAGFPQSPPGLSGTAIYQPIGFLAAPAGGGMLVARGFSGGFPG